MNRRRRVPNTVSMSFEETREMPTSQDFGRWMIDQGLSPSKGIDVKRFSRSEYDNRFYMQLDGEEMVDKFLETVGEAGREWKEPRGGQIMQIKAKKEGDDWILVKIANIDQDTDEEEVKAYFGHIGEVKEFKQEEMDGMMSDTASIKVKLKEDAVMPAYLVVKGVPGDREGVVRWELDYPDKPSICYRCYQSGHWRRDCRNPSVPITALLARPDLAEGGVKGSYAQVVRSMDAVDAEEERRSEQERERVRKEEERVQEEEERRVRRENEMQEGEEMKRRNDEEMEQLNRQRKELQEQKKEILQMQDKMERERKRNAEWRENVQRKIGENEREGRRIEEDEWKTKGSYKRPRNSSGNNTKSGKDYKDRTRSASGDTRERKDNRSGTPHPNGSSKQ